MVIFLLFLCKISWVKNLGATTWQCYIQIGVIKGTVLYSLRTLDLLFFDIAHVKLVTVTMNMQMCSF